VLFRCIAANALSAVAPWRAVLRVSCDDAAITSSARSICEKGAGASPQIGHVMALTSTSRGTPAYRQAHGVFPLLELIAADRAMLDTSRTAEKCVQLMNQARWQSEPVRGRLLFLGLPPVFHLECAHRAIDHGRVWDHRLATEIEVERVIRKLKWPVVRYRSAGVPVGTHKPLVVGGGTKRFDDSIRW